MAAAVDHHIIADRHPGNIRGRPAGAVYLHDILKPHEQIKGSYNFPRFSAGMRDSLLVFWEKYLLPGGSRDPGCNWPLTSRAG